MWRARVTVTNRSVGSCGGRRAGSRMTSASKFRTLPVIGVAAVVTTGRSRATSAALMSTCFFLSDFDVLALVARNAYIFCVAQKRNVRYAAVHASRRETRVLVRSSRSEQPSDVVARYTTRHHTHLPRNHPRRRTQLPRSWLGSQWSCVWR